MKGMLVVISIFLAHQTCKSEVIPTIGGAVAVVRP
jgi:hypothetical protein